MVAGRSIGSSWTQHCGLDAARIIAAFRWPGQSGSVGYSHPQPVPIELTLTRLLMFGFLKKTLKGGNTPPETPAAAPETLAAPTQTAAVSAPPPVVAAPETAPRPVSNPAPEQEKKRSWMDRLRSGLSRTREQIGGGLGGNNGLFGRGRGIHVRRGVLDGIIGGGIVLKHGLNVCEPVIRHGICHESSMR